MSGPAGVLLKKITDSEYVIKTYKQARTAKAAARAPSSHGIQAIRGDCFKMKSYFKHVVEGNKNTYMINAPLCMVVDNCTPVSEQVKQLIRAVNVSTGLEIMEADVLFMVEGKVYYGNNPSFHDALIGPMLSYSAPHFDVPLPIPTALMVLYGSKMVIIFPGPNVPDSQFASAELMQQWAADRRYVFNGQKPWVGTLKAGQGVIIPPGLVHAVVNLEATVSYNASVCSMKDIPQMIQDAVMQSEEWDKDKGVQLPDKIKLAPGFVEVIEMYGADLQARIIEYLEAHNLASLMQVKPGPSTFTGALALFEELMQWSFLLESFPQATMPKLREYKEKVLRPMIAELSARQGQGVLGKRAVAARTE